MSAEIACDPAYAEGFWDAQAGEPLFDDADPAYAAGWRAGHECLDSLRRNGFIAAALSDPPSSLPNKEDRNG